MVFLDTNILLELLIAGRPLQHAASEWLRKNEEPACVSMLTVHLVFHFGKKAGFSKDLLKEFLSRYIIQDLTVDDYQAALRILKGRDYEDALQLAVALRCNCAQLITIDKQFAAAYKEVMHFSVIS